MDVLILIPARMAATRLPGKPLAEISGEPMILHVLRRALAADLGPVVVATDAAEIATIVDKSGGIAVMTRADHASGSDRIYEALGKVDSLARAKIVVNLQGDLPTLSPEAIAAALLPLDDPAVDIATLAAEIRVAEERTNPNVVKVVGTPVGPSRLRALYSRAPPRLTARARSIIISAFMRIAGRRWSASFRSRRRRSSAARNSSNCARSKPACASTSRLSTRCRSGSTRPKIWKKPAPC